MHVIPMRFTWIKGIGWLLHAANDSFDKQGIFYPVVSEIEDCERLEARNDAVMILVWLVQAICQWCSIKSLNF